jgi:DNA-binding NtrC family response regulator
MVGKSGVMQRVYDTIRMVAKTDFTVLITGESGTGKDLTARAIHAMSDRNKESFVAVNCPTVPENILESELFGYKKGAFTHATHNRSGLFQEAHNGSIFLDEIGDVSPTIQTKLLRVLQEKEIKPLGDTKSVKVDVRIIASTNQDLKEKIRNGEFREDFFYRLNVLPIKLPSLRDHREDIPLIVGHLLEKHCTNLKKPLKQVSSELMDTLVNRTWEGNVREMENLIIQGILFSRGDTITPKDIGAKIPASHDPCFDTAAFKDLSYKEAKEQTLKRFNLNFIGDLLAECRGNVTQAAKTCGMERQALQQIMRRYDIKADSYRTQADN